jgi:predicted dithiol-disulfide oxidoreductase (DUF899 family)
MIENHNVVSHDEWLAARRQLLAAEKQFTRLRDQLSQQRRDLSWERVDKEYIFNGPNGKEMLADLFAGRSQLIIYHFMFGPGWAEGCPGCSFWADNFNGIVVHLKHRDMTMLPVSHAPLEKLQAYQKRMGWTFKWMSSYGTDFNYDYHVSFTPDERATGKVDYNYNVQEFPSEEAPGISVFHKNEKGEVFHTYSCYARGLDMMNTAYHYMDLAPKGRDEDSLPSTHAWLRRHDQYDS